MPVTALLVHHHRPPAAADAVAGDSEHCHPPPLSLHIVDLDRALYSIHEHEHHHGPPLISTAYDKACANQLAHLAHPIAASTATRPSARIRRPRLPMATIAYSQDAHSAFAGPPDSPPDLTHSKSSKASSFHSSTLSDLTGPSDLSHFEDINLDEATGGPPSFPLPVSPNNRLLFEAPKSSIPGSRSPLQPHFRQLTSAPKSKNPSLKVQVHPGGQRQHSQQLSAPGKQARRGFSSPSAPSLTSAALSAPSRSPRSQSPSNPQKYPSSPRSLSRTSSRTLDVLPSPLPSSRRQSWQDTKRKSVKEREAECDDDDDDELPEDAVIWNIPISPRPAPERSPVASSYGSPSPALSVGEPSSSKNSPVPSLSRGSSRTPSPNVSRRETSPSTQLTRQRTGTWEETYTSLDADAKKLTEALEEFQSEFERKQDVTRQQPGLTRSASLTQAEPKAKRHTLPPVRKSDPLIDPFQPSVEKQKYLSRTRPSWLPPKNPKEEKKHLKEYQRMLARIEEAERLEAQRAQDEALAREKASRLKAEFWSTTLLPNWATEMTDPDRRAAHRKMWWSGVPPRLRGQVWQKAIGNDLEVTEATYNIALDKAKRDILHHGQEALGGRFARIVQGTNAVFPELKMFGAGSLAAAEDEQPLHQDLVNVCLAYATYRPDISHLSTDIVPIAALLLLNLPAPQAFVTLSNMLNRPLPLSFLVHDANAIHAAYVTTIDALANKSHSFAQRLESLRVEPRDYLFSMFSTLFCGRLDVEHAARIMDVYSIEGDKIPPRVAIGIMLILEGNCVEGDVEHVASTLREKPITMDVEEFMTRVYEAGKSNS